MSYTVSLATISKTGTVVVRVRFEDYITDFEKTDLADNLFTDGDFKQIAQDSGKSRKQIRKELVAFARSN